MNSWIASADRTVSERIAAPPDVVRAFYVDLDNLRTLHPFLVSVRSTDRQATAEGYVQTYKVREDIPLGPVKLPIRFVARLSVPESGDVVTDSYQFPRVHLHTVVSFEPAAGGTLLTERIRIEAPRPLAGITVRQGLSAHREMLAGIAAHHA